MIAVTMLLMLRRNGSTLHNLRFMMCACTQTWRADEPWDEAGHLMNALAGDCNGEVEDA